MLSSEETRLRLIQRFWSETNRNLNVLRDNLSHLQEGLDREAIKTMFIAAHTIKGNLGMMQLLEVDLPELNTFASDLETLMMGVHNQELTPSLEIMEAVGNYLNQLESQLALSQRLS